MDRPLLLRAAPIAMRERLFFHLYRRVPRRSTRLFERAELALAPGVFMALSPSDVGHQPIALAGIYETALSTRIVNLARAGGLMLDVGANYGYFSCLWASVRRDNRVLAFEVSPRNLGALRRNLAANRLGSSVEVRAVAAGREAGVMGFQLGPQDQTGQGGFSRAGERSDVEVPVVTLDDVMNGEYAGAEVAVLKVDVEGADTWVLEGAQRLLRARQIRHVFFEQHGARMAALGIDVARAPDLLTTYGYRVQKFDGDEWYATAAGRV